MGFNSVFKGLIILKPDPFVGELVVNKWFRNNPSIILFVQFVGI